MTINIKHKIIAIVLALSISAPVMAGGPDIKKPEPEYEPVKPIEIPIESELPVVVEEIDTVEIVRVDAGPDRMENSFFWQNATSSGAPVYYWWSQVSGAGKIVFTNPASEDTTISADKAGTYVVQLTVAGADGNPASDEFTLVWETVASSAVKEKDDFDDLVKWTVRTTKVKPIIPEIPVVGVTPPPLAVEKPTVPDIPLKKATPPAKEESKGKEEKAKAKKPGKGRFLLFGNLTAYGSYSRLLGKSSILGGNTSGMLAPTYKFSDKWLLIFLGKGYYVRSKQVFTEDRGPKLRSETANYAIQPTLRYNHSDKLSIIPSVFFSETLTRETEDEQWHKGLYDYIDKGAGVDFVYQLTKKKNVFQTITLGLQHFNREYGNFVSLLNLAGLGTLEEKEKDFNGNLLTLTYKVRRKKAFSYTVKASGLFKEYIDKRVENSQGGRDPASQSDQVYTLGVDFDFVPASNYSYSLGTTLSFNSSNQNLAEGLVPSIIFTSNYYEYISLGLKPSVEYKHQLPNKRKIVLGFAYGITVKKYSDREAKDGAGTKTGEKEMGFNHNFTISSTYKIDKNWGVGAIASLQVARSNNVDERTYLHNYEILNLSLGFTYRY